MDETGRPEVGDVFITASLVFANGDHAYERPVVVVRAPMTALDYLTVIQRSSTATAAQAGVHHPCDQALGLNKDGRWVLAYQRAARCDQFLAAASFRGRLPEEYLAPLVGLWEQQ